ncbi:MAG: hypothetical protein IPH66_06810 [Crocinitomicaceae bacterium]|nr:hypothetical protein [Crocinitomicaceae bacterium]
MLVFKDIFLFPLLASILYSCSPNENESEYAIVANDIRVDSLSIAIKNLPNDTNSIISSDGKYRMRIYETIDICEQWRDRESEEHQFICVEISRLDGEVFRVKEGARHNSIVFQDVHFIASAICYQQADTPSRDFLCFFPVDAFDKLQPTIGFSFTYGPEPYMIFNDNDVNNLVESFTSNSFDETIPVADSAWLVSVGLGDYLTQKK